MIQEALAESIVPFQLQMHEEVQNLHVELIRQFQIQLVGKVEAGGEGEGNRRGTGGEPERNRRCVWRTKGPRGGQAVPRVGQAVPRGGQAVARGGQSRVCVANQGAKGLRGENRGIEAGATLQE